jgi:homoserine kinase type II
MLAPQLSPDERGRLLAELDLSGGRRTGRHCRAASFMATSFRDNVLCAGEPSVRRARLLFRRRRCLLFDLAVTANDWCADAAMLAELIAGYETIRPLTVAERGAAWPAVRRAAALRFWLLRLEVRHRPRVGTVVTIKDPDHFGAFCTRFRLAPEPLPR